jgi:hypothetical protein
MSSYLWEICAATSVLANQAKTFFFSIRMICKEKEKGKGNKNKTYA